MKIYFYDSLVAQTFEMVKRAHDCADVLNDLNRIGQAKAKVRSCGDWRAADQLNYELRQKYPCIDAMNEVASSIPVEAPQTTKQYSIDEAVIENLTNDFYGILCDTAIKKGLIHSAKEFIQSVD